MCDENSQNRHHFRLQQLKGTKCVTKIAKTVTIFVYEEFALSRKTDSQKRTAPTGAVLEVLRYEYEQFDFFAISAQANYVSAEDLSQKINIAN